MSDLYVVVGLGATGLSCAHYLKNNQYNLAVMDTRENPPHLAALKQSYPDLPVSVGGWNQNLLDKADCIVLSPGIALSEPLIADQINKGKKNHRRY